KYPYKFLEPSTSNFGIGLFSKYELKEMEAPKLCPDDIRTLIATFSVHDTEITLINTHPIAPLNEQYYDWRNEQLKALAKLATDTDGPLILVGDLNSTCFSPFFKQLLRDGHLSDSEVGFGIQPSWSALWWPAKSPIDCVMFRLPLDHVLIGGPLVTVDRR